MRFLKPLLSAAVLVTLVAPAAASAEPFFGGHDGRGDYQRNYDRSYRYEAPRAWRGYDRDGWRYNFHSWRRRHEREWRDWR